MPPTYLNRFALAAAIVLVIGLVFTLTEAGAGHTAECRGNSPRKGCPVLLPANGSTVRATTNLNVTLESGSRADGVQFQLDGTNLGAEDTVAPYELAWDTTKTSNATHTISAVVRAGGDVTIVRNSVTVANPTPDTTPPTAQVTSPAGGATLSATSTVVAAASDNVGVVGVQFRLDGSNLGSEDTSAPYEASWNTTTTPNGTHVLSAVSRDAAGNRTTSSNVSVTVSNNTTVVVTPTVQFTSPTAGSTVAGTASLAVTTTNAVGVQFKVDNVNVGAEDTVSPFGTSWTSTSVANGSHTITAVARASNGTTASASVTVTVSNSATVPPPPPPPATGGLAWAPPALTNPITLDVRNGSNQLWLDTTKDYVLRIQEKLVGRPGLYINGGRNVVVIGGEIEMNQLGTSSYWDRTGVKIQNSTGVVHLEGLRIRGAYLADGVATAAPAATIRLQNVKIDGVKSFASGEHPDCVQAQAGLGRLQVDRFTCATELQGFFLSNVGGYVGSADIRRTNINGVPGKNLFWQHSSTTPVALSDVWLNVPSASTLGYSVYPNVSGVTYDGQATSRKAVLSSDQLQVSWINTNITGVMRRGAPPAGDFCTTAGIGYVSPGYAG